MCIMVDIVLIFGGSLYGIYFMEVCMEYICDYNLEIWILLFFTFYTIVFFLCIFSLFSLLFFSPFFFIFSL